MKVIPTAIVLLIALSFRCDAIRRVGGPVPILHSVFDKAKTGDLLSRSTSGEQNDPRHRRPKPVKSMQVHARDVRALFIAGGVCIGVGLPTYFIAHAGTKYESSNLPTVNILLMIISIGICITGLILLTCGASAHHYYKLGKQPAVH